MSRLILHPYDGRRKKFILDVSYTIDEIITLKKGKSLFIGRDSWLLLEGADCFDGCQNRVFIIPLKKEDKTVYCVSINIYNVVKEDTGFGRIANSHRTREQNIEHIDAEIGTVRDIEQFIVDYCHEQYERLSEEYRIMQSMGYTCHGVGFYTRQASWGVVAAWRDNHFTYIKTDDWRSDTWTFVGRVPDCAAKWEMSVNPRPPMERGVPAPIMARAMSLNDDAVRQYDPFTHQLTAVREYDWRSE